MSYIDDKSSEISYIYEKWYDPIYKEYEWTYGLVKERSTDSEGLIWESNITYEVQTDGSVIAQDKSSDEKCEYDADGKIMHISTGGVKRDYQYDGNGNRIKLVTTDENGSEQTVYEYEWDEKGHIVKTTCIENGERVLKSCFATEFTYDEDGNYKAVLKNEAGGKVISYFDRNQKCLLSYSYDEKGTLTEMHEYDYNEYGDETGWIMKDWFEDGTCITHEEKHEYDEKGRVLNEYKDGELTCSYEYQD